MPSRTIRGLGMLCLAAIAGTNTQAQPRGAMGDYAGQDVCVTCHVDEGKHFQHTVMGKAFAHAKNDKEKLGCEACHGPGKAHVDAGGGKDTIPMRFTKDSKNTVEEKDNACLTCHEKGNRMFWEGSPHETRKIACVQ